MEELRERYRRPIGPRLSKKDIFPEFVNSLDFVLQSGLFKSIKMELAEFDAKVNLFDKRDELWHLADEWCNKYFDWITPTANDLDCSFTVLHDPDNSNASTAEHANIRDSTMKRYKGDFTHYFRLLMDDGYIDLDPDAEEDLVLQDIHLALLKLFASNDLEDTRRLSDYIACIMTAVDEDRFVVKDVRVLSTLLSATIKLMKVIWSAK